MCRIKLRAKPKYENSFCYTLMVTWHFFLYWKVLEIYCISEWHTACLLFIFIIRFVRIVFFGLKTFLNSGIKPLLRTLVGKYADGKSSGGWLLIRVNHVKLASSTFYFSSRHMKWAFDNYFGCKPWLRQVAKVNTLLDFLVHLRKVEVAYSP